LIAACAETARDPYAAPGSAEEFERLDGPRVRTFIAGRLSEYRAEDRADAAAAIWTRMVENQVWEQYRSTHVSAHTGRLVSWKYFINSKALLYVRGWREKLATGEWREPLRCDAPVGDGASTWAEVHGGGVTDSYPSLAGDDSFEALRDFLALHPPSPAPCSMVALLDELHDRASMGEKVTRSAVAERFGLSVAQAAEVLASLKAALKDAKGAELTVHRVTLGGVQVTAADVRTAIDRLKAAKGNRVSPAWRGHPLEKAEQGWYVRYAREELKRFRELRGRKGGHYEGGHARDDIKRALIHRLERVLTELGAPEPEPEVTAQDLFEAELHRLGIPLDKMDLVKAAAGRVFAGS
jgi:hypothetical protein